MKFKSKIALGLALVILVSLAVTGVAYWTAQEALGPKIVPGLQVDGEYLRDPGVMMTVNGEEIGFDEYRYYYLSNIYYMEMSYGEGIFEQDYDGALALQVRTLTEDTIIQTQAWLDIAEEKGISLSEEEKQEILTQMDEEKAAMGEDAYLRNLESLYYTSEEMYIELTEEQMLIQNVQDTLTEEYTAEIEADLDSYFVTAKHILISAESLTQAEETAEEQLLDDIANAATQAESAVTSDVAAAPESAVTSDVAAAPESAVTSDVAAAPESAVTSDVAAAPESAVTSDVAATPDSVSEPLTEEEQAVQIQALADDLLAQLRAVEALGEDSTALFDQFVVDYGADPGMVESPEGYTFAEGTMVDAFYQGAMALQPGEISELVETDFGYHIIRREPLDMTAFEEGGSAEMELDNLVSTKISEEITAYTESAEVTYGEYYSWVTPMTMQ